VDPNNQTYEGQQPGTGGTGTATAAEPAGPVKLVRNEDGDVRLGTWPKIPEGYVLVTGRQDIVEELLAFNAAELREKIAELCGF
jgi:hypothetical protein